MKHRLTTSISFLSGLLSACASNSQSNTTSAQPREPECSFRSATTCWTLGTRFPNLRPDSTPGLKEALDSPTSLAAAGDSAVADTARQIQRRKIRRR